MRETWKGPTAISEGSKEQAFEILSRWLLLGPQDGSSRGILRQDLEAVDLVLDARQRAVSGRGRLCSALP